MERKQGTDVCAKLIVLLFMRLWYFNRAHFCHTLIKLRFNDIILVSLTLKVFFVPELIYSTTNICDVLADWWHRLLYRGHELYVTCATGQTWQIWRLMCSDVAKLCFIS